MPQCIIRASVITPTLARKHIVYIQTFESLAINKLLQTPSNYNYEQIHYQAMEARRN